MKNITIFLAIICYATSVYAQEHNGRIIDANTREPLAFANVVALAADSTMIQGTTSADDGSFSIVANGATMLYISYIGYTPQFLTLASWSGGDVLLQPSASSIGEVKISASRPTFKMERGSLITEVQGSFLSSMGQAT
ncbi:MAG: carboxypeptidase-like regulatory domain-containing protein, partial [Bacteroidales bacterium]|nr:carboxypeptidase-like regulatory domain-containing protein [Bacteroidales bacterium]